MIDVSYRRVRRNGAAALTATALLAAGMVGGAAPASADGPSGTVTVTTECNADGSMAGDLNWTESYTGLIPGPKLGASYQAHILIQGTTKQWGGTDATSYWYADSSGDYTASGGFNIDPSDVKVGDAVTWTLDHIADPVTEVASGSGALGGPSCRTTPPPPDKPGKPTFSIPPSTHVAKSGKFMVRFAATPKATGRVTITKKTLTLAAGRFTVPASGKVTSKLTLGKKKLEALKHKGHEAVKVTVTVKNAGGSATSHTTTVLRAPKH